VPVLKAAIEDPKADRLQAGWDKLERHGVIKEVTDVEALRERAVEQHLKALRSGKTSLMISPRHEEARKVAAIVRRQLKAQGGSSPLGSRARSLPGPFTLHPWPSDRIPYAHGGRVSARRDLCRYVSFYRGGRQ
jgi:hypothetical protein